MSNSYYNAGSFPATGAPATSASMRAELALIAAGFDKLPTLTGNGNKLVLVNSGGTGLTVLAAPAGDLVGTSATQTLTNKTINLASNTLTGTLAEFNAALSDANFASIAGAETLTNKTLTAPVIATIVNTGTLTLPTSSDTLVGRGTTDTLTNKTISGSSNTLSNIANASLTNSSLTIGSTAISLGATSTTLAGLTSVTSTAFVGALTGAASSNVLKAGDTMTGNLTINNGTDSRVLLQVSGTTQAQLQATGSAIRLASNNTTSLVLATNGVDRATLDSSGNVTFGSASASGSFTFQGTNTGDLVVFESTDASSTAAPDVVLYRNSASPAASDQVGNLLFRGKDSGGSDQSYARILATIVSPTAGSEEGDLRFGVQTTSGFSDLMTLASTGLSVTGGLTLSGSATLNGGTANGVTYLNGSKVLTTGSALVFDGTNLGVGTSSPYLKTEIVGTGLAVAASAGAANLGLEILSPQSSIPVAQVRGYIATGGSGIGVAGDLLIAPRTSAAASIRFITGTSPAERMRIDSSGNVGIGTSSPSSRLDVADATSAIITLTRTDSTSGNGVIRSVGNTGVTNASINFGGGVNNNMVFTTNAAERMRISSTGGLSIGTTTDPGAGGLITTGNVTLGDATTDTVTVNGYMSVGGIPNNAIKLYTLQQTAVGVGAYANISQVDANSSNTSLGVCYEARPNTAAASFTISNLFGLRVANSVKGAGSTISNLIGVQVQDLTGGDSNFGIQSLVSSGSNKWNIYASGTAANYFAGSVSIGSTSPQASLVVASAGALGFEVTPGTAVASTVRLLAFDRSTTAYKAMRYQALQHEFYDATTERMRIDSSGNVGIGTTTPANQLVVSSASNAIIQAVSTSNTTSSRFYATNSDGDIFDFRMNGRSAATNPQTAAISTPSNSVPLQFNVSGVEIMRMTNVGLGIGTTPGTPLDASSATNQIVGRFTHTNAAQTSRIYAVCGAATGIIQQYGESHATNANELRIAAPGALSISTGGSFKAVIDSSGNIIRGASAGVVSTGGSVLGIETLGGTTAASSIGQYAYATTNAAPFLEMGFSRNATIGSHTVVNNGDVLGAIRFSGSDGTNFIRGAQIAGFVDGTPGTNDMPGGLYFSTTADGASTPSIRMTLNASGNLGLGVTPSAWASSVRALEMTTGAFYSYASGSVSNFYNLTNAYLNSAGNPIYKQSSFASQYLQTAGQHQWYNAPSGTAGNAITFTQAMTLDASGNLGVGTTSPGARLEVSASGSTTKGGEIIIANSAARAIGNYSQLGFKPNSDYTGAVVGAFIRAIDTTGDVGNRCELVFGNGQGGAPTESMRIDNSGNVQISKGAVVVYAPGPASISTAATLTNANIQSQIINTTGTSYTVTMPLGSTMETLVIWSAVNLGYDFTVINTASGTITMAVNTGVTSLGALTIATGTSAQFRIRRTAANTFILYRMS